tara:strand:+ start:3980 stop:4492 length:513 start_codon:yes stop_codon:yes gene_type:complete
MKIFDISEQFNSLSEMSEEIEINEETGEIIDNSESLTALFNDLEIQLGDKLDNTNYIIKELTASETYLKEEAKRLIYKAKVFENRQIFLKELMKGAILASGQSKIKTDKFSFSTTVRKSLNYDDVSMFGLDSSLVRVKEELDKTKIKEYIKHGGIVEGIKEVENTSLSIR